MIEQAFPVLIFSLVFFVGFVMVLYSFLSLKPKAKPVRNGYILALIISLLFSLSGVFLLFEQIILWAILFFGGAILGVIAWILHGKTIVTQKRKEAMEIASKKGNEALTFSDIFTAKGWIKIALRLGTTKATILSFFFALVVSFWFFLILTKLGYVETLFEVITDAIITSVFASIIVYLTVRKI